MGIRDYVEDAAALLLIEWPQKGEPVIPCADLRLQLVVDDDETTRHLTIAAGSAQGAAALRLLSQSGLKFAHTSHAGSAHE